MKIAQSIWRVMAVGLLFSGATFVSAQEKRYEVERTNDIEFAKPGGVSLLLDLYMPKGVENPPLVVFIHGGSWRNGDRKGCKIQWVANHGYALASIEYRMSQEALFPAQIEDCKGALRWLRANAKTYSYNAEKVVIAGSSAGGHLALLMGTSGGVAELEGTTAGNPDESSTVQGIIDYYGPSDFVFRSKTQPAKTEQPGGSVFHLLGGKATENLEAARTASPITYVTKDDPPLLILHGAKDTTVFLNQSEVMEKKYRETGLEVTLHVDPEAKHGWKSTIPKEKELVLGALSRWFSKSE